MKNSVHSLKFHEYLLIDFSFFFNTLNLLLFFYVLSFNEFNESILETLWLIYESTLECVMSFFVVVVVVIIHNFLFKAEAIA